MRAKGILPTILFLLIAGFMNWVDVSSCIAQDTVELLVILKQGASIQPIPKDVIAYRRIPGSPIFRIKVSKDRADEVMRRLKARKGVRSIERSRRGMIKDDPEAGVFLKDSEWYEEIKGEKIDELSNGSGVIVAVIDSGIDLENSMFLSRVFVNKGETPGDSIDNDRNGYIDDLNGWDIGDNDNNPQDENGHGTEISSIILTLAPGCRILPIKINEGGNNTFSTASLVEGIFYALSFGAKVINLSLTVDGVSEAVAEAIQAAYNAGAIMIAAAGNDYSGPVEFPASMNEVIAVGGIYQDLPTWFSPMGAELEIVAPGLVKLITLKGAEGYGAGTSFSCAIVSGTAAALFGMNPRLKNKTVRLLLDSGTRDLGEPGRDTVFGEGALAGEILFQVAAPDLILPERPSYKFSRSVPIPVSFHIPPTDTRFMVYVGIIYPDNTLWWLDGYGNWHNSQQVPISPIVRLEPSSESIDGVLFGENGAFPAFDPSGLAPGLYQWGIAITDESGQLLGPITWDYMLLF